MKIKKHTITHAIKYIFLSLLLALPFIAMLPSTFYYAFNQNAQDNTANEVNYPLSTANHNGTENLQENKIYKLATNYISIIFSGENNNFIFNNNKYGEWLVNIETNNIGNKEIYFYVNGRIYYEDWNIGASYEINTTNTYNNLYLTFDAYSQTLYDNVPFDLLEIEGDIYILAKQNYLNLPTIINENIVESSGTIPDTLFLKSDFLGFPTIVEHDLNNQNAFYYASSQVFEKPLFNWVENSIFVVPIMGMLGIFGISEMNFISSLLVYWVNILSIYAILNIILLVIEKLGSFGKRKNE